MYVSPENLPNYVAIELHWMTSTLQVSQRNVPGIDRAFLAMDCEEGVEVVWNEVQFSERKSYKTQEVGFYFINLYSLCQFKTEVDRPDILNTAKTLH